MKKLLQLIGLSKSKNNKNAYINFDLEDISTLDKHQLKLAAYLGHSKARSSLGENAPKEIEDLEEWVTELHQWGKVGCIRATIAAIRLGLNKTLEACNKKEQKLLDPLASAIKIAEECARCSSCPCEKHTPMIESFQHEAECSDDTRTNYIGTMIVCLSSQLEDILTKKRRHQQIAAEVATFVTSNYLLLYKGDAEMTKQAIRQELFTWIFKESK